MSIQDLKKEIGLSVAAKEDREFRQLFDIWFERIHHLCLRYIRQGMVAEETAMDVMFRIWKHQERINEVSNPDAFIFRIAHNAIISTLRKKDARLFSLDEMEGEAENVLQNERPPHFELHLKELQHVYEKAVAALPQKRQQIFLMHRESNLTSRQIAKHLNLSPRTVEHQVSSALQSIRAALKEYGVSIAILITLSQR
jgi:RNA polymerase sigma-70 factor (ECF subfamily)